MTEADFKIVGAGEVIAKLLDEAGINITELGRRINASRSLTSRYVSNERPMSRDVIYAIADALHTPREELVLACFQVAFPEFKDLKIGRVMKQIVDTIAELESDKHSLA